LAIRIKGLALRRHDMALAATEMVGDADERAMSAASARWVRLWLFVLAGLIFAMVVVGGATRMTGSGLSITEWKPVLGALPPLNAADWASEFEKYRQIPQYRLLNHDMSLDDFKAIYWWEWGHRQLGRFVGLVFALGWLLLVWRGHLRGRAALYGLGLGLLGGAQGAVGWVMVASGLREGMTAVAPVRLMAHLTLASTIYALTLIWATRLRPRVERVSWGLSVGAKAVLALTLVQIALGGLVAGSHAGLIYNTWPTMNGDYVPPPEVLFATTPWIENFVDNVALVQFNHRLSAYVLLAAALWHAWAVGRAMPGSSANRRATINVWLVGAQAALGIATLLYAVPLALGLLHQAFAMVVLGMTAAHAAATQARR
jgi:cytochrome c oxidase assembly protein subunit 15